MTTPLEDKSTTEEIRQRFDNDVATVWRLPDIPGRNGVPRQSICLHRSGGFASSRHLATGSVTAGGFSEGGPVAQELVFRSL